MMDDLARRLPANPAYGEGYFVRSTVLRRRDADHVEAVMEDPSHALALSLCHDDHRLLSVEARWERHPLSSCAGAGVELETLAGVPLIDDLRTRWPQAQPTLQCTHMFDTLRVATVHAALGRDDRRYEVILPDTPEGLQPVRLRCNGETVLEVEIDADFRIQAPDAYAGAPLLGGFAQWASERLSAEMFEYMFLIQRGAFVGRGQRFDVTPLYGLPGKLSGPPPATCFGSQPERYEDSVRMANARPGLLAEDAARFPFA